MTMTPAKTFMYLEPTNRCLKNLIHPVGIEPTSIIHHFQGTRKSLIYCCQKESSSIYSWKPLLKIIYSPNWANTIRLTLEPSISYVYTTSLKLTRHFRGLLLPGRSLTGTTQPLRGHPCQTETVKCLKLWESTFLLWNKGRKPLDVRT